MSLAERCYRLARRHDKAVRYAIARAQHPLDEALRNYLLLVSRAHGLHSGVSPEDLHPSLSVPTQQHPTLQALLHDALGGDPFSLGAFHDLHTETTGSDLPSARLLHEAPLDDPLSLLAGLHHRTLSTNYHRLPLPVERMFSPLALSDAALRRAVMSGGFPLSLQALAGRLNEQHGPLLHGLAHRMRQTGDPATLPDILDVLHAARPTVPPSDMANNAGHALDQHVVGQQNLLHRVLGMLEQHHGLGG